MKAWQLGNTTVRSAMRIRDGLIAYSKSEYQGDIRGVEGDRAFRQMLGESGIVSLGTDDTASAGRKWRSVMGKLGFIYPKVAKAWGFDQEELGKLDCITPSGWSLIRARSVASMQECYLRAMVVPQESAGENMVFSPLCWVLAIIQKLEREGEGAYLTFLEMEVIVQFSNPGEGIDEVLSTILDLRRRRDSCEVKKRFDREELSKRAALARLTPQTLRDYADENIRYLKATGLLRGRGRGISIVSEKCSLATQLTGSLLARENRKEYLLMLCQGAKLPTDDFLIAKAVLRDLMERAHAYGIDCLYDESDLEDAAFANRVRYDLEEKIFEKKEEAYSRKQVDCIEEIEGYLNLLAQGRKGKTLPNGTEIGFEQGEAPAYLEWAVWRAMLAIDHMTNKPYEARRFKVDQDFLPVCTAPGNGPDIVVEFEEYVLAVEVTLSVGSRQEAMEGEPVRRHVAALMCQTKKPVYALFIAAKVDTNTVETFRNGIWYGSDDERMGVHIVPLTILQFAAFLRYLFESQSLHPSEMIKLIRACESEKELMDAPGWRRSISETVEGSITDKRESTMS